MDASPEIQVTPIATETTAVDPALEKILEEKSALLTKAFKAIHRDRMSDVPILNEKIKVTAIGFQPWQDSYLGVMVTPWFMNLMMLPGEEENWDDLQDLSKLKRVFPSGNYEFIVGSEQAIGKYQMCSLFSPMFEFEDDAAAVDTATVVMIELMNEENIEVPDIDSKQIEDIWNGVEAKPEDDESANELSSNESDDHPQEDAETPALTLTEKMEKPISRRELLRNAFMLDEKE